jgi:hypothetical protein
MLRVRRCAWSLAVTLGARFTLSVPMDSDIGLIPPASNLCGFLLASCLSGLRPAWRCVIVMIARC